MDNLTVCANTGFLIGYIASMLKAKGATQSEIEFVLTGYELSQKEEFENFVPKLRAMAKEIEKPKTI